MSIDDMTCVNPERELFEIKLWSTGIPYERIARSIVPTQFEKRGMNYDKTVKSKKNQQHSKLPTDSMLRCTINDWDFSTQYKIYS